MEAPRIPENPMPTVEERLAFVEGRQQDHFTAVDDLRTKVREFRADSTRQLTDVRADFTAHRVEVARQFGDVRDEIKNLRTELRGELSAHRAETSRQFTWLVGIQMATLVAMVGALAGAYYK